MKLLKAIMKNWKTTATGLGAVSTGAIILADSYETRDHEGIAAGFVALFGGLGLIFGRDADKSTEDSQ